MLVQGIGNATSVSISPAINTLLRYCWETSNSTMVSPLIRAATLALRAASNDCPALPACPQNNGCSLSANGVTLQVNCGTDYYGGDLQRSQVIHTQMSRRSSCLIITGLNSSRLYERLFHHHRLRCCKLCERELLHKERTQCWACKVRLQTL